MIERLLSLSIMAQNYSSISYTKRFQTREQLWLEGICEFAEKEITYLEFGVWKGESIRYFAANHKNQTSEFYGFDSFEGLPEKWDTFTDTMNAGFFSVQGALPDLDDKRIKFIKGWFQNTVGQFLIKFKDSFKENIVVHYDADLYSSTLLCLMEIDSLKKRYLAIFDEFPGHETRALYNYQQATGAKVEFIGRVGPTKHYPTQVMCWITPTEKYEP